MDLTFQVPMQYCSLQHRTLLLSPDTSTIGYCFCFGSIPSFFLELFLHWSPVAYRAPTDLGSSSFSILSFCLFILFVGFSRQEYWSGLPFPFPVDHICPHSGTLSTSWTWVNASFPMWGKFSTILSSNIFSGPFSLSSPFGTPIMCMLVHLTLSQRSLKLSSFLLITFSFILFHGSNFYNSVFQLIYLFISLIYSATNSF